MGRLFMHDPFDTLDSIVTVDKDSVRTGMLIEKWNDLVREHGPVGPVSNTWAEELVLLLKKDYGFSKEEMRPRNGVFELPLRSFRLKVVRPEGEDGYAVPLLGKMYVNTLSGIAPSDAALLIKGFDDGVPQMEPAIDEKFQRLKDNEEGRRKLRARRDILMPAIKSCQERFLSPEGINVDWTLQSDGNIKLTFRRVEECSVCVSKEEMLSLLSDGARVREMLRENMRAEPSEARFINVYESTGLIY